jgi:JmjC domain
VTLQAVPDEPIPATADEPLARCTGDAGTFVREAWGRRAEVHRGGDARGFSDLLTFDEVDRLLTTTALRTPSFRLVQAGERIPESSYTRSGTTGSRPVSGMVDPARVAERFRGGATIVLQGLHRYHEPVARFCRDLELRLGHPCQANAYITPPGTQGLELHEDPHDVFVLQAFGRKRWEIHAAPREAPRDPLDATLGPGDCAYLPTGTPHAATTQDELSGHVTIGVHVGSWRDLLDRVWARVASAEPALGGDVPPGWHDDPDATAAALAERLTAAAAALGGRDARAEVDAEVRRFLSTRGPSLRGIVAEQTALHALGHDTPLRRRPGSVCELQVDGDRLTVLLGDRRMEMPARLEPALELVRSRERLTPADLDSADLDAASRLVLARRLVREGLLLLDDGS